MIKVSTLLYSSKFLHSTPVMQIHPLCVPNVIIRHLGNNNKIKYNIIKTKLTYHNWAKQTIRRKRAHQWLQETETIHLHTLESHKNTNPEAVLYIYMNDTLSTSTSTEFSEPWQEEFYRDIPFRTRCSRSLTFCMDLAIVLCICSRLLQEGESLKIWWWQSNT